MVVGALFCVRSKFVAREVYEGLASMASGLVEFFGGVGVLVLGPVGEPRLRLRLVTS